MPKRTLLAVISGLSFALNALSVFAGVPHVILIQNSGWMEPFYSDPKSEFKPLVKALSRAVSADGSELSIFSFNQTVGSNQSPQLLTRNVGDIAAAERAIDGITVARKPGSTILADTDFLEAITSALTVHLGGKAGVVWIVTNNKNSPNNSPEIAKRNREFYDLLHVQEAIKRIVAYPLRMQVLGKHYRASGLMIYGIAYGQAAADALRAAVAGTALKNLFADPPARLKPLTEEALSFVPKGVRNTEGVAARQAQDGTTIVVEFEVSNKPITAQLVGQFRNEFHPYQIDYAKVTVEQQMATGPPLAVVISPHEVSNLAAGALSQEFNLGVTVPALPSLFSLDAIFSPGYQIRGRLLVTATEQRLSMSPAFPARMKELFPGDPLPALFAPSSKSSNSVTSIPLLVRVDYPVWPLVVVALSGLLLGGIVFFGIASARKEKKISLEINGIPRKIVLKAFDKIDLRDDVGNHVATVWRGFGSPKSVWVKEGMTIRIK